MYNIFLQAINECLLIVKFISLSCDEVTTIDNQSWLSMHVYMIDLWKQIPILLNLQQMVNGASSNNLTSLIVQRLINYGGYSETNITNKLVCFAIDGVTIFQGLKYNVTI